jgi:hypothetical protein
VHASAQLPHHRKRLPRSGGAHAEYVVVVVQNNLHHLRIPHVIHRRNLDIRVFHVHSNLVLLHVLHPAVPPRRGRLSVVGEIRESPVVQPIVVHQTRPGKERTVFLSLHYFSEPAIEHQATLVVTGAPYAPH